MLLTANDNLQPGIHHVKARHQYEPPHPITLLSALFCVEPTCETIFDGSYQSECPRCGSRATFPVSRWLNRAPAQNGGRQ